MPLTVSGWGRHGGGPPGAPRFASGGNINSALPYLTPANTRPKSLRPGMVLVGTVNAFGTATLGPIPVGGKYKHAGGYGGDPIVAPVPWIRIRNG